MAKERLRYRVQHRHPNAGNWYTIARFMMEFDALGFARGAHSRHSTFRVLNGRRVVEESLPPDIVPPSDAAGDRAEGEGTGAPGH